MQSEPSFTSFDQIESLPHVTWRDRGMLPRMPGLYFVVVGTELLYVGKSGNLWDRWYQYPLHAVFEGAGPYAIAYHTILDPEALALAERETIRALRPPLNFHYIPGALEHQRKHRPRFYGPRKTPPPA